MQKLKVPDGNRTVNNSINHLDMSNYIVRENGVDFIVVEIDAAKCLSKTSLYQEFATKFQFPHSKNAPSTDVLLDFVRDLGWFQNRNFILRIINLKKALKINPSKLDEFQELCNIIQLHWENHHKSVNNPYQNNFRLDWTAA